MIAVTPMTIQFVHDTLAQRVVLANGQAAAQVRAELERLDARAAMVIGTHRTGALLDELAPSTALRWTEVTQHVPVELAERARVAADAASVDAVVAVGGGSAIGLAKAIALSRPVPVIAVPTTYAGSEATDVWGLTDGDGKRTGSDARVLPTTVIYDPELVVAMPRELAVASGLNAVAHCVDSLWAPRADPINAALATEGLTALHDGLRALVDRPDDLDGRARTQYGCYLAAVAFASAGSAMHHKICHVLGGSFDLPHAATHAVVLPYVLAWNSAAAPEASRRIAAALGAEDPNEGLARLRTVLEAPTALRDIGLEESDIPRAAAIALAAIPPSNPRPVSEAELTRLLHAAWAGRPRDCSDQGGLRMSDIDDDQSAREAALTDTVLASFDGTANPRLHELIVALTTHLHRFAREVRLTEAEWAAAIEFLTGTGHITDDKRQEFILLSDVLGLSMQTITINHPVHDTITESTVLGPFFVDGAPEIENGGDLAFGAAGEPCWVEGTVRDEHGTPVAGARLGRVGGRRRRVLRRPVRRRSARRPRPPVHRGRRQLPVLGPDPDPVPDPGRRPGGAPAGRDRAIADAGAAPALHGGRRGPAHADHPHLRGR